MRSMHHNRGCGQQGFTLVEVVIVLVIAGILMTVAMRSGRSISESAKIEETKQEMDLIASAIVGNPQLTTNGTRSDFGYVGDVGALPSNLSALTTNPGYATWKGPYLRSSFAQLSSDLGTDAWGSAYAYSGGVTLQSSGSGSSIIRTLASSTNALLRNSLSGSVTDFDGTPPGTMYKDSITLRLTYPNGSGGTATRIKHPAEDGYYSFDSLPVGHHALEVIYEPLDDTLQRIVTILPSTSTNADQRLTQNLWTYGSLFTGGGGGGVLVHVPNSDTARGQGSHCDGFLFWVQNPGTSSVNITSLTATWSAPTGYYTRVRVGGRTAYNRSQSRKGSGELTTFSRTQTIRAGESVRIWVDGMRASRSGNSSRVPMSNTTLQISLSDGSSFSVVTAGCM